MAAVAPIFSNEDQRDRAAIVRTMREQGWVTSGTIREWTGISPVRVRQLCQIYPCLLISSSMGYKLAREATSTEIQACVQSLLHRSEKIMQRASALTSMI